MRDNFLLHVYSAELWEIKIEDDHIRDMLIEQSQCSKAVVRHQHFEPFHSKRILEHFAYRAIVLYEQNSAPFKH